MNRTFWMGAAAVFGLFALSPAVAEAGCGGAVRFAPGTDGASVSGSINGDAVCDFTLKASKGQKLSATLKAANGVEVIVFDPVEHALAPGEPLVLPQDATYTIRVLQTRNAARKPGERPFALSLRVTGKAGAAPAAAAKPAAAKAAGTTCDGSGTLTDGQANVSGTIAGDATCDYTISAKAGQTLNLLMDAPAGVEAYVVSPVEAILVPEQPFAVTTSGDHTIRIGRTRNDARKGGTRDFSAVLTVE